jgi:hypothetical protein
MKRLPTGSQPEHFTPLDQPPASGPAAAEPQATERHGVDPRRIVFEITELGGDIQRLAQVVTRYRQAGARIAIDDFGAGYSARSGAGVAAGHSQTRHAPVPGCGAAGRAVTWSRPWRLMAEKTGCWIIAEGVETEAQLNFALECGSRYVQGFLFAGRKRNSSPPTPSSSALHNCASVMFSKTGRARTPDEHAPATGELMAILQAWAQNRAPLSALPQLDAFPWLLRFYQCDRHGTQLTPNLEWRNNGWVADDRYLGHNWSWRPYFYHLLAEGWDERRLTLSSTYRDATSNQYCLTAGQFFDNGERLLLIDIDAAGLVPRFSIAGKSCTCR